jgi:choline-glycine betaine transporter
MPLLMGKANIILTKVGITLVVVVLLSFIIVAPTLIMINYLIGSNGNVSNFLFKGSVDLVIK